MRDLKLVVNIMCLIALCTPFKAYSIEIPATTVESAVATLEISTDKTSYQTGEIIQFKIAMAGDAVVDIYMTATFPDGNFSSYSTSLMPDGSNSIIPFVKGFPLADFSGEYTLPLPVIPLWPEGTSEIWLVFVKAQKNPMISANWLAEDKVTFNIDQLDDVTPLFDLENKTFTAPIGEMGTLEITFGEATVEGGTISGSVEGSLVLSGPVGATHELGVTGTYIYQEGKVIIHLEGEDGFFIDISLAINEDGTLTGTYETVEGKSGDIEFTLPAAMPE